MKSLPLLLALSLAANLACGTWLLVRRNQRPTPPPAHIPPASAAVAFEAFGQAAQPALPASPAPLAPDDFAGLSARLASSGLPPHVAKVALTFAIKQHFEGRRLQLGLRRDPAEITRHPISNATSESAEIEAARREVNREEQELIRSLGGDEVQMSIDGMRRIAGNLPQDKASRLLKIIADYRQMEALLGGQGLDRGSTENRERVALLQKEQRADIERLLTPEELFDYDVRTSAVGGTLRNRLGMFAVNETEFRALYAAAKPAEEAADSAGVSRRARDRDSVYESVFKGVLGENRYAELQRARELENERISTFKEMAQLTKSLNLPTVAINDLLVIQAEYRPRLMALEAARAATAEQLAAQVAALAREAATRLSHILGPDGFAAYRARHGQWLTAAEQRP